MNKSKFLILIIIGLLISNGTLFFMFTKEHKRKDGPKAIIINKLHLDAEQVKKYDVYIQEHRKAIKANEIAMNALRSKLYKQLNGEQDSAKIDSLVSIIAEQQNAAEHVNYNHFLEIKNLCKPSQVNDFKELSDDIANLFSSKERKR